MAPSLCTHHSGTYPLTLQPFHCSLDSHTLDTANQISPRLSAQNLSAFACLSGSSSVRISQEFIQALSFFSTLLLISCVCLIVQSCLTLCHPVGCSMLASSGLHCLPEFAQIHDLRVGDALWPSYPLLLPFPFAFPASRSFPMNRLFISGDQSNGTLASVLPMNMFLVFFLLRWNWYKISWTYLKRTVWDVWDMKQLLKSRQQASPSLQKFSCAFLKNWSILDLHRC